MRKLHVSRHGSVSINTTTRTNDDDRDMLADSLRSVTEDPRPLIIPDPLSLSLRSEVSTSSNSSRLSSRLLYTQKKLRDLETQFGTGSRGYKSSSRVKNLDSSMKKMPPPPPRDPRTKRLAFEEEADSLDDTRGIDSLDEDDAGWKRQFESSTGSSASAWALLAGSRRNETKRTEGGGGGGSVTAQIIRKLHAELADRDRALSYTKSESMEASRRADIERQRADAAERLGRRMESTIRQEQQNLALMTQELSHQRDQDELRSSIRREQQNAEFQQLREENERSKQRVWVEEQSLNLEADFCTSWQRECREEKESLRRMRNSIETLESTVEAEAELCSSLTSRTMRGDESLEVLREELKECDHVEREHLRKVDRLEEILQKRESFDALRRSTKDRSFEMKEQELEQTIQYMKQRETDFRERELEDKKELQRVLEKRYRNEIEIAVEEAEKTGAKFARDEVSRRHASHEHAMKGLRNANELRIEEHERAMRDVREEHERAMRDHEMKTKTELEKLRASEEQNRVALEQSRVEKKAHVLKYENEVLQASKFRASEEAWLEMARNAEEAQMRISNEAADSLRQQRESMRKELESEKRFAKEASVDVQRLIEEQTDAMSRGDLKVRELQSEISDMKRDLETVDMLKVRIATVNSDHINMEKEITDVKRKYQDEITSLESTSKSSCREQIGRMARAEHHAIGNLQREIEEGTKQAERSTEEIATMREMLSVVRREETEVIRHVEMEAAKMIKNSEDRAVEVFASRHQDSIAEEWEEQESQIRLKLRRVRWDMQAMRLELDTEIEAAESGREAEKEKQRLENLVREHEASSHLALLEIEDRVMEQQAAMVSRVCDEENAYRKQLSDAEERIASSFVTKHREMSIAKRSRVETELDNLRSELEIARSDLDSRNDESKSLREALERSNESMKKYQEKVASSDDLNSKLDDVTKTMDTLKSNQTRSSVRRLCVASNRLNKTRLAWAMNRWRISVFSTEASNDMVKRYQRRLKRQNRAMEQMRKRFEHEAARMEAQIERLCRKNEEDEEDVTISVLDLNLLKEEDDEEDEVIEEEDVPKWRTPPRNNVPEWRYNDDGKVIRENSSSSPSKKKTPLQENMKKKKTRKKKTKKKSLKKNVDNFWSYDIPPFPDKSTRRRADHQHWKVSSSHRRGTYFGTFAANKDAPIISKDQWRRGALRALKKAISKRRTLYGRRLDPTHLQNVFSVLDRSHDGHVDESELKSALKRLDIYLSEKQEHKLFHAIDRNSDGLIQLSEFRYLMNTAVSNL